MFNKRKEGIRQGVTEDALICVKPWRGKKPAGIGRKPSRSNQRSSTRKMYRYIYYNDIYTARQGRVDMRKFRLYHLFPPRFFVLIVTRRDVNTYMNNDIHETSA